MFSFADGARQVAPGHAEHREFGHTLFQEGFYLDADMPEDTRALLGGQYEEAMKRAGRAPASALTPGVAEPRRVKDLMVDIIHQASTRKGRQ